MAPLEDRLEMSLEDVIRTDWKPKPAGGRGRGAATRAAPGGRGRGAVNGAAPGRGRDAKGRGRGAAAAGRGAKGRGRGNAPKTLRNGVLGVRRTIGPKTRQGGNAQGGAGRGRGKQQGRVVQQPRQQRKRAGGPQAKAKGKGNMQLWRGVNAMQGKGGGRGKAGGKMAGKGAGKAGNRARAKGKAAGKGSKGKGWGRMALPPVNRKGGIQKQGRGAKGGMMALGGKGRAKGKGWGKKGGSYGPGKGGMNGKGMNGNGSGKGMWEHDKFDGPDFGDSWDAQDAWSRARGASKGKGKSYDQGKGKGSMRGFSDGFFDGGASRPETPRGGNGGGMAEDMLSAEDRRMMKKITIVAQLDKVPKPPQAMQGLAMNKTGKRSSGDTGTLSSRFGANFDR
uniref:Uncharacterized protein n=1 Tax=Alexandrium monilatum TaxID=311494 RepID=A0A7S4RJN7_9DINO